MLDRAAFAQLLKVSEKTVQNWELGKTSPRNRLGALEQYLDPQAAPAPQASPRVMVERRVRDSGLFHGAALERAINLAWESYLAEHPEAPREQSRRQA